MRSSHSKFHETCVCILSATSAYICPPAIVHSERIKLRQPSFPARQTEPHQLTVSRQVSLDCDRVSSHTHDKALIICFTFRTYPPCPSSIVGSALHTCPNSCYCSVWSITLLNMIYFPPRAFRTSIYLYENIFCIPRD